MKGATGYSDEQPQVVGSRDARQPQVVGMQDELRRADSGTTCGAARRVERHDVWTGTTCGAARRVERHDVWSGTTCGAARRVGNLTST